MEFAHEPFHSRYRSAAIEYPGIKEAALAFVIGADERKEQALIEFIGDSAAQFDKVLDLAVLNVTDGYHRSAYEILAFNPYCVESERSLTLLGAVANKMLEGTYHIGANRIYAATYELVSDRWPKIAATLPHSQEELVQRYGEPFHLREGSVVNLLRDSPSPDLIDATRKGAKRVVDDLFENKVYGWVVSFLIQSQNYNIMDGQLFEDTLCRLNQALDEVGASVCRWHLEATVLKGGGAI